jgi:tryptophan-rich sensory protein
MASDCVNEEAFEPAIRRVGQSGRNISENLALVLALRSETIAADFTQGWFGLLQRLRFPSTLVFGLCCLVVAVVSVHDAALVALNNEVIGDFERNPVGKWLLDLQGGEVWLFIFVKLAATALVCAVLITVYQHCRRYGLVTAAALASFQLMLLCYLSLG